MKMSDIRTEARKLKMQKNVEIIFIDYITRIKPDDKDARKQRWEQVMEISSSLKDLARELDIPVVALTQLTREAEQSSSGKKKQLELSNISASGAIEQDADVVIFIQGDRDVYKNEEEVEQEQNKDEPNLKLVLAKQRNGEVGVINIVFKKKFQRITETAAAEA
jgi:replicative DNA helicase